MAGIGTRNPPNKLQFEVKDVGRPSKFTPERRAAIIDAISRRAPYELAAEGNGIHIDTLYDWLRQGREDSSNGIASEYAIFSDAIKKVELERVLQHNDEIASKPERWQADAWLLERRWNKFYGANAHLIDMNERLNKLEQGRKHHEEKTNEEEK